MTNEIKEILDDLDYCKSIKSGNILLKSNECDDLLDYITNLQEDLANYVNIVLHNRKVIDILQQRIDKAVEYIENDIDLTGINGFEKLLDILQGDE